MKALSILTLALIAFVGVITGCAQSTTATFGRSLSSSSAAAGGNASVQLNWTASTGSPYGYYVQQSTDGVNFTTVQTVTSTSTVVSGLYTGKSYYFRIQAYNQGGTSSYTTNTLISIPVPSPSPSASSG